MRRLDPHKRLSKAKGRYRTTIERQIAATVKAIDQLVYELYGLTDKEFRMVEEGAK